MTTNVPITSPIHARIAARQSAALIADLIRSEMTTHATGVITPESAAYQSAFFAELVREFPSHLRAAPTQDELAAAQAEQLARDKKTSPMADAESVAFGQRSLPYGMHKGEPVDSVSLSYLTWLAEDRDEFRMELKRYLKSGRIQAEQGTSLADDDECDEE